MSRKNHELRAVRTVMWFDPERRKRGRSWRTEGDPGVRTTGVGRQRGAEEAEPRGRRTAAAPTGEERRSGSPAERRRGPWAGSEEACLPRRPGRWSWSAPAGGWCGRRGCAWRDAAGARGCEEAAPGGPRSSRRRRRWRRRTGRGEAGGSAGGGPTEPGAWGAGRRGGSGPLPWEPAALPSPTTRKDKQGHQHVSVCVYHPRQRETSDLYLSLELLEEVS